MRRDRDVTVDVDLFFPGGYGRSRHPELCNAGLLALDELMPDGDLPRVPGWTPGRYEHLLASYGQLPVEPTRDPVELVRRMTRDLLSGAVNWRCPELQYNLGAPVNVVAAALYPLALEVRRADAGRRARDTRRVPALPAADAGAEVLRP